MIPGVRWGVMATIDDVAEVGELDVDFLEILMREGDDLDRLETVLEATERASVVHAPERMRLDGRSRLLDLADEDPSRRRAFARHLDQIARLADRHGAATVVHPGGVRDRFYDNTTPLARNLAESLSSVGGRLWIENMPRRYHAGDELLWCNLLLHPEEFDDILSLVDGVTLDVCHAYLSVDMGGNSAIASFFERLKRDIRHVHLSDAAYPHREGLQLGDGDIDLTALPRMRGLPVLLEVWGGHLNDLAGYRTALDRARKADWFRGCVP